MDSHELTRLSDNMNVSPNTSIETSRWDEIDLGLIPKIFKGIFVNISDKVAGILTILTTIM